MNAKPKRVRAKTKPSVKRTRQTTRFRIVLKEIPDLSSLSMKLLDVDSIVDVPCFCCKAQDSCEPEYCEKLTEWLMKKGANQK